jgi:polysaccharide biosynthesis protein PslG
MHSRVKLFWRSWLLLLLVACSGPAASPTPVPTAALQPRPTAAASAAAVTPPSPSAVAASPSTGPSAASSPVPAAAGQVPTADPAVHVFLWGNPATTSRDLQLARDGGFHWVKQRFEWRNIEGKAKGSFEWDEPDRIVDAISQTGLKIVARVDNQPKWASTSIVWPGSGPPDKSTDWTDYLTALATRYKGRIQAYEIWNEPNLDREWGDKKPDPAAYTSMLTSSYQAIKAADPQALVVSAGMSPTTTNDDHAMPDLDFIRAMYAAGAMGNFDILGVHAAGFKADPCADPGQVAQNPDLTNNDPSPTDLKRTYAFRHVEDVHALMVQQGDNRQMGVMEMGWTTDARPDSAYLWFAVDRDQQAKDLVGAFQCARQNWQPWMGFMTVIYIPDPAWTQQQEQYWWSITNPDGTPRPAYTALKTLFATNP